MPHEDDNPIRRTDELQASYDEFVNGASCAVDVEAGLVEVLQKWEYDEFVENVRSCVDVEAGLSSLLNLADDEEESPCAPLALVQHGSSAGHLTTEGGEEKGRQHPVVVAEMIKDAERNISAASSYLLSTVRQRRLLQQGHSNLEELAGGLNRRQLSRREARNLVEDTRSLVVKSAALGKFVWLSAFETIFAVVTSVTAAVMQVQASLLGSRLLLELVVVVATMLAIILLARLRKSCTTRIHHKLSVSLETLERKVDRLFEESNEQVGLRL